MYKFQVKTEKDYVLRIEGRDLFLKGDSWTSTVQHEDQKEIEILSALVINQLMDHLSGDAQYRLLREEDGSILQSGEVSQKS